MTSREQCLNSLNFDIKSELEIKDEIFEFKEFPFDENISSSNSLSSEEKQGWGNSGEDFFLYPFHIKREDCDDALPSKFEDEAFIASGDSSLKWDVKSEEEIYFKGIQTSEFLQNNGINMDIGEDLYSVPELTIGKVITPFPSEKTAEFPGKVGDENGKLKSTNSESLEANVKLAFECSVCSYKTHRKCYFKRHLLSHSSTKLFKCSECSYECNQKGNLKRHFLTHTSKMDPSKPVTFKCLSNQLFRCSECNYECSERNQLKNHSLTHSAPKLFKCSECAYECNRKDRLKAHSLIHSDTKLFKCSKCNYECNQKSNLERHLLNHPNPTPPTPKYEQQIYEQVNDNSTVYSSPSNDSVNGVFKSDSSSSSVLANNDEGTKKLLDQKKKRESKSKALLIEAEYHDNLPKGWKKVVVQRTTGATAGKYDVFFFTPSGRKLRSKNEIKDYSEKHNLNLDLTNFGFSRPRREIKNNIKNVNNFSNNSNTSQVVDSETSDLTVSESASSFADTSDGVEAYVNVDNIFNSFEKDFHSRSDGCDIPELLPNTSFSNNSNVENSAAFNELDLDQTNNLGKTFKIERPLSFSNF